MFLFFNKFYDGVDFSIMAIKCYNNIVINQSRYQAELGETKNNMEEIKQRSVEWYFQELGVSEDKKEKVLMGITDMVYKLNKRIVELEKETDSDKRKELLKIIDERDGLIKEKITQILEGKEDKITYDY